MDMRSAPTLTVQLWACHHPSLGLSFPLCAIRIGLCGLHVVVYLIAQLCLTPCNPLDCSPLDAPVHGVFQARILEWVAFSSSRESSCLRDPSHISCVSCVAGRFFTCLAFGEAHSLRGPSLFKVWGPLSLKSTPRIFPLPVSKAQMLMTDWELWFSASRFSSCLTSSRPRQHSPCLLLPSGRTSFHLWTLSTGTIITTWCRCHPPPELFLENDCWQQVFAALQSHQTVECREKLFARLIFKKKKKKQKKSYLVAFQNR